MSKRIFYAFLPFLFLLSPTIIHAASAFAEDNVGMEQEENPFIVNEQRANETAIMTQLLGDAPPGFEDSDGIGNDTPVGEALFPLVLLSGIYSCRIILKKKKDSH